MPEAWIGPALRLGSYGWAYAAQFMLTLVVGVALFADYVAATALALLCAFGAMAGVSDLLTRQWSELIASRNRLLRALWRFAAPRLALAFTVTAILALAGQRQGWLNISGGAWLWLSVASFGLLSVALELGGIMLACLGRPSLNVVATNGLLGLSLFGAAGCAFAKPGAAPPILMFHIASQLVALSVIMVVLAYDLKRVLPVAEGGENVPVSTISLKTGVTVTAVHLLEIARNHLPILLIQIFFQTSLAALLVTSLRFSRAIDVISAMAIAMHTRAVVTGGAGARYDARAKARRLSILLAAAALAPLVAVVAILCHRAAASMLETIIIVSIILLSGLARQIVAIDVWLFKVAADPGRALLIGLVVETLRLAGFFAMALSGHLFLSAFVLVFCDLALMVAMSHAGNKACQP